MHISELNSRLIITSGDNLLYFDPSSAATQLAKVPPPDLPPNLTKGQLEVLNKEDRTINCVVISQDNKNIAIATENKQIVIFDDSLNITKNFIVNRAASKVLFTKTGDILVADRTGDVYLYKFEEKSKPVLLLGHLSMILDMALTECEKYIITCDRDEKIRVSHFPNTYNIVSFCLGHEEFVTTVKTAGKVLVSASGDGTVRVWEYLKGEQKCLINTNEFVRDKKLLDEFSCTMDKEKVDVMALPITDMQILRNNDNVFVAVSLYNYSVIQTYKINLESYNWSVLTNIEQVELPHRFYLSHQLYVFDNSKVTVYKVTDDEFSDKNNQNLNNFYNKHKDILKIRDDAITVLYKRKFDNVQEYLERKKLRLESAK